ncbi:MAG: oligosaccharide flippase family protein, partial [Nitrospiraceae bacterium]
YGLSMVLARSIGLILLPILTRFLSPADYGTIELLAVAFALLNLVLPLEVSQGMVRLQADEKDLRRKADYASTAFWFTASVFGGFVVLAWITREYLSRWLFGASGYELVFSLAVLAMTFNALLYVVQNQLRFNLQSRAFGLSNVLLALVTMAGSVALIVGLSTGVSGYFIASLGGNVVALVFGVAMVSKPRVVDLRFNPVQLREMLAFSAPLVLSGVAVYLTSYADRWLVRYWLGLESLGLYGVAFRIASVTGVVVASLQMAITPLVLRNYSDPQTPLVLRTLLTCLLAAILPAVGLLAALSKELVVFFAGSNFEAAAPAAGWLSLGVVLTSLYVFAPGMGLAKQTKRIALVNGAVSGCNVTLGLVLIPILGIMGAALAYVAGGLAMITLYFKGSHRFYAIPYPFRRYTASLMVILIVLTVFAVSDLQLSWRLVVWAIGTMMVWISLFIGSELPAELVGLWRTKLSKAGY